MPAAAAAPEEAESPAERHFARARQLFAGYRRAEAERHVLRALEAVDAGRGGALRRERVLLTLAAIRSELGHLDEGLEILDRLDAGLPAGDEVRALVPVQRAGLLFRAGRHADALPQLDEALRRCADGGPAGDPAALLLNRASCRLSLGRVGPAAADYRRCAELAAAAGDGLREVQALTGLAYADHVRGDVPAALAGLDALLGRDDVTEPGVVAEIRLMRADALLAAGLLAEADAELEAAGAGFARLRMHQDAAEGLAVRAQVALADDRPADAARLAARARAAFDRRGSSVWARLAELTELQGRLAGRRSAAALAERAERLAAALRETGPADDAALAALLAAQALLRAGRAAEAEGWAARGARRHPGERPTTRVRAAAVRAELSAAAGDPRAADRRRRAGLRELHRWQSGFGSLDAQTAVARHGRELVRAGLGAALRGGDPASVLAWAEEGRALASRLPPVVPPDDAEAAAALEELRLVRTRQREAELAGAPDAAAAGRRAELERLVRQRSWHALGPGEVERPASPARVRAALAERSGGSGVLVAHLVHEGEVHAVLTGPRRPALHRLGPVAPVLEALRRVAADLDALAVRGHPARLRELAGRSLRRGLATLDDLLWAPLGEAGDGPVLLVPAGALAAAPWTALPGLRGRPLTVARSATAWCRSAPGPAAGRVVSVAGPGLARGDEEARTVGAVWPGSTVLTGAAATGSGLLAAASGADVLHVAAHGRHEPESPLFSALRLADGPVFGHDLVRLPAAPRQVVLSACDLGLAVVRPGEEVLGMTAALLHAGAGSVVAGVARVNDDVACEALADHHRRLRAGGTPAEALAGALGNRADAPLVCFGAGW